MDAGKEYDAVELIGQYSGAPFKLLVDQGASDNFLVGEVCSFSSCSPPHLCQPLLKPMLAWSLFMGLFMSLVPPPPHPTHWL